MVAGVIDHLLAGGHGHRRAGGDLLRHGQRTGHGGGMVVEQAVDEAQPLGALGAQPVAGVGQLAHHRFGDLLGHAVQRAHVGHHADVDLLDAEPGLAAAVAQAAGRGQVDRAADAAALDGGDDRKAHLGNGGEAQLQLLQLVAEALARGHVHRAQRAGVGEHAQVHAGAEVPAFGRQHRGAHAAGFIELAEQLRDLGPEGRRHRVVALRLVHADMRHGAVHRHVETGPGGHGVREGWIR